MKEANGRRRKLAISGELWAIDGAVPDMSIPPMSQVAQRCPALAGEMISAFISDDVSLYDFEVANFRKRIRVNGSMWREVLETAGCSL